VIEWLNKELNDARLGRVDHGAGAAISFASNIQPNALGSLTNAASVNSSATGTAKPLSSFKPSTLYSAAVTELLTLVTDC